MEIGKLHESDAAAWCRVRLEVLEQEPFAFGMSAEQHRATTIADTVDRLRSLSKGSNACSRPQAT